MKAGRTKALVALGLVLAGSAVHSRAEGLAAGVALPAGQTRLESGAVAYRPATAARSAPLLVLLHGAGGYPANFLEAMKPLADRLGMILVAPRSGGKTWDLIRNLQKGDDPWRGPDARRMDQTLKDLLARPDVDSSRVILLGFSDGASYALSLGASHPKQFSAVIALSPGMLVPPRRVDRSQRVFIAHGRSDSVLPFAAAKDIAEGLRSAGGNVRFRPFEGGHRIDRESLAEGLDWILNGPEPGRGL